MEADIGAYYISEQSRPRPATGAEYLGCSGADFGKSSKVLLWVFEIVRNRFSAYWLFTVKYDYVSERRIKILCQRKEGR